jgi:putative transposase
MPLRRTSNLHAFRWSSAGVRYFVTCCTAGRRSGLDRGNIGGSVRDAVIASDAASDTATIAFVLMPDHFHWLCELGNRLSLGRVVAKLKAQTRATLAENALEWQRDFFEHRLRPEESVEDYARYVYLNPFRAPLPPASDMGERWWTSRAEHLRFLPMLNPDGTPPLEWLNEPFEDLVTGESP